MNANEWPPILLIEDETPHADTIIKQLTAEGCTIEHFESINESDFVDYKMMHPDSKIVILDLELKGPDGAMVTMKGLDLMKRTLWRIDRTLLFVIFSKHVGLRRLTTKNEVKPVVIEIKKELGADGLPTKQSLENLSKAIKSAKLVALPMMAPPRFTEYDVLAPFDEFARRVSDKGIEKPRSQYREMAAESVRVMSELSEVASAFSTAGDLARQVTIGVFGSCGRYEIRPDSDIELTAFYFAKPGDIYEREIKELAVNFWNRLARSLAVREIGYPYEGKDQLPEGRMDTSRIDEEQLPNRFLPIIPIERLLSANPERVPHLHDRYLQLLVEVKPVFNKALGQNIRRQILELVAPNLTLARDLARNETLGKLVIQFVKDTVPPRLTDWKNVKGIIYRYMNVLALHVAVMHTIRFVEWERKDDPELHDLLRLLGEPGVIKLAMFANSAVTENLKFAEAAQNLTLSYLKTLSRFRTRYGAQYEDREREPDMGMIEDIKVTLEHFASLFDMVRESKQVDLEGCGEWLGNSNEVRSLKELL